MSLSHLFNFAMRHLLRKATTQGVNAGINRFTEGRSESSASDTADAARARQTQARKLRQAMNVTRRITRL